MKTFFEIFALLLIAFGLLFCFGIGVYLMYVHGWHKVFYLSLACIVGLVLLSLYVKHDVNKTIKKI